MWRTSNVYEIGSGNTQFLFTDLNQSVARVRACHIPAMMHVALVLPPLGWPPTRALHVPPGKPNDGRNGHTYGGRGWLVLDADRSALFNRDRGRDSA